MGKADRRIPKLFLAERFWPGVTSDAVEAMVSRLQLQAAAMTATGTSVRHVSSTLVAEEETCLCFFEAESAELVAELNERAHARFDRIVAATASRGHRAVEAESVTATPSTRGLQAEKVR